MCGIAGISISAQGWPLEPVLSEMAQNLRHRGPDGSGTFVADNGRYGLAHTRLAIVDLSERGAQPITSADGKLVLTYNGEIYNYPALRQGLEQKGRTFRSDCDSEVILHLYELYGETCVEHLQGMFAFAIYDTLRDHLFCARDPLGKKPFVYAAFEFGTAFASEIPALLDIPGVDRSIDPEAVSLYLLRNLRHIPDPWTLYKGVRKLPPGHVMTIGAGRVKSCRRYWQPSFNAEKTSPETVLEQLDRAVGFRRMADVEIGALLSGGVDSTAIVDSLQRQGATNIRTYAFGRDENDEELVRARHAASLFGTQHQEHYFDPDEQHDYFDAILAQLGEPVMALPLTHAYALFGLIKKDGIKVVLTGHGADEVFFGYSGFNQLATLTNIMGNLPERIVRPLARALASFPCQGSLREALAVISHKPGHRKEALYRNEAARLWPRLLGAETLRCVSPDLVRTWISPWFSDGAPDNYIDEAAFLGLMQENAHAVTIAGDLPAMANGVEVRCPFLDRELVESALRIPYQEKVSGFADHGHNKKILKLALGSRLPADILYAPKRGFGYYVQEEDVLRGPWKERVHEAFSAFDDLDGIFDRSAVQKLKSNFDTGHNVDAILIAKLYAIQRSRVLTKNSGTGSC